MHDSDSQSAPRDLDWAVQTQRLCKRYGNFDALIDLTLEVQRGEVFGLLGPNGAGKTTLLRTLLGFLHRSSGSARVMGIDPAVDPVAVRRHVSYLPGDARLPRHMRGRAVLRFFAEIQPTGDLDNCLSVAERLELDLRRHVGFMSTGMRQKLAIAAVIGSRAPLLILDEPTANLDPTVRSRVLEMVMQAKQEGRTVIFSSHVLSEIEEVCDCVALLRGGRLAHQQSLHSLKARHRIVAELSASPSDPMGANAASGHNILNVPDSMDGSNSMPSSDVAAGHNVLKVPDALDGPTRMPSSNAAAGHNLLKIPEALADAVAGVSVAGRQVTIETAGDLAPLLPWLASLGLRQMRVEAFGLRAVYDSVHCEEEV